MRSQRFVRTLSVAVVVLAAVGLLDSLIGRVWDLVVVFAALLLLGVGLVWGGRRAVVTLRPDLAARMTERAWRTGEPLEQVTDRAVATFLDALDPSPQLSDAAGEPRPSP